MKQCSLRMLKKLCTVVRDAVYPARCCGCDRLYHRPPAEKTRNREPGQDPDEMPAMLAEHLCAACIRMIEPVRSPLCVLCGHPFDAPQGVDHLCAKCRQDPFDFGMARSEVRYANAIKAMICQYKYRFRSELASPLSRILWQTLCAYWDPEEIDCIIPVPLHPRRLRQRGFNQAELLIRPWPELARRQGIRLDRDKIRANILLRCRHTEPQTKLDRGQRVANLQRAFKLCPNAAVQGRRVLLVDDVLTTGATVNACSQILKNGKAASVDVLTLARAV